MLNNSNVISKISQPINKTTSPLSPPISSPTWHPKTPPHVTFSPGDLGKLACNFACTLTAPPWTPAARHATFRRGPHASAARHYASFLLQDMYEYVQQGYWLVLP